MDDQEIRNDIVHTMLRKRITGAKNRQMETVVNMALPTHERGRGKELVEELIADPEAPIHRYGGARGSIRLTSLEDAAAYLKKNDGDVPFGWG